MAKTWTGRLKQQGARAGVRLGLGAARILVRTLPRRAAMAAGGFLGGLAFRLLSKERQKAEKQIEIALGDTYSPKERYDIIKRSFQNLAKNLIEVLRLARRSPEEVKALVEVEGEDSLKKAVSAGRGVIFVTGHLGNWELMAMAVALRFPLAVVAAPIYDSRLEKLMIRIREAYSIHTIIRDGSHSLRQLIGFLRKGGVVGVLIDQDTRVDGVFVPFFGKEAYTPSGPAMLALRTSAEVVIGFIVRLPDDRYRVMIQGPVGLIRTEDASADIKSGTALFTGVIEKFVREHPDQWIWMHERWKTARRD